MNKCYILDLIINYTIIIIIDNILIIQYPSKMCANNITEEQDAPTGYQISLVRMFYIIKV